MSQTDQLIDNAKSYAQRFEFADRLEAETGERPEWSAQAFSDLGTDIRDGIERIKASSFIPHTDTSGASSTRSTPASCMRSRGGPRCVRGADAIRLQASGDFSVPV